MADKKRGIIARALGVGKKKPKRTITGGYSPDKRSQGQKHGQAAKKKAAQAKEQKRHTDLLTNYGKGTPKETAKVKKGQQGPKQEPRKKQTALNVTKAGPKKVKTNTKPKVSASVPKPKAKPAEKAKKSLLERAQESKKTNSRSAKRAKKLAGRAEKAIDRGKGSKAVRLAKRSKRNEERAAGTRRTVAGTALAGAKRFLGNYGAATSGVGKIRNYKKLGYKKPNPAKLTSSSTNLKVQNKAAEQDKKKK